MGELVGKTCLMREVRGWMGERGELGGLGGDDSIDGGDSGMVVGEKRTVLKSGKLTGQSEQSS